MDITCISNNFMSEENVFKLVVVVCQLESVLMDSYKHNCYIFIWYSLIDITYHHK